MIASRTEGPLPGSATPAAATAFMSYIGATKKQAQSKKKKLTKNMSLLLDHILARRWRDKLD
jgi:hypothetical protein